MCGGARQRRLRRWTVAGVVVAVLWLGAGPSASGQPATAVFAGAEGAGAKTGPAATVLVHLHLEDDADGELAAALRSALMAQFAGMDARLQLEVGEGPPSSTGARLRAGRTAAGESGARALFWVEAQAGHPWLVIVLDPATERMLARELPSEPGTEQALAEAAAVIVAHTTDALLRGAPVGLGLDDAGASPSPAPPPTPAATAGPAQEPVAPPEPPAAIRPLPRPPPRQWMLGLGYLVRYAASELTPQGGLQVAAGVHPTDHLQLRLDAAGYPEASAGSDARVRIQRYEMGGELNYALPLGRVALRAGLGLQLQVLHRRTDGGADFSPAAAQTDVAVAVRPAFSFIFPLWSGAPLAAVLRADAPLLLSRFDYVVEDGATGQARVVLSPARVQPGLSLDLELRL